MVDDAKSGRRELNSPDPMSDRVLKPIRLKLFGLLTRLIGPFIHVGHIHLSYRNQATAVLGDRSQPPVQVTLYSLSALWDILRHPDLAIGERYMAGDWDIADADLANFVGILLQNDARLESTLLLRSIARVRELWHAIFRPNDTERSRRNAAHHYDIGNDLYKSFLDSDMLYSCAFYTVKEQSLEEAQQNKINMTLDRLALSPGMKVLDIGCGWGALTRAIARRGAHASGITLAEQQLTLAQELVPPELADHIDYHLQDYRIFAAENADTYDRVVSIGMFEHVGRRQFETYFEAIRALLKPGGRAVVHSIVKDTPSPTNAWVDKYIFPGGFIPTIEDMSRSASAVGLQAIHDPFVHHSGNYAQTLRHWRERFNNAYDTLDHQRYDMRFKRMWNFYLAGSEAAFDSLGYQVSQIVIENPLTATNRSRPLRHQQSAQPIRQRRSVHSDARDPDRNRRQG